MKTYKKITDLIGKTPLLELETASWNTGAAIFAKLEYFLRAANAAVIFFNVPGLFSRNTEICCTAISFPPSYYVTVQQADQLPENAVSLSDSWIRSCGYQ